MHRATDIVERLLVDVEGAETVWLVQAHPSELEMIIVGGYYTDHTRRRVPRGDTVTDLVLASGEDVMLIDDLWSNFLRRESRVAALSANAQSSLSAVVRVQRQPWGLVSVTSQKKPCPFTSDHAEIVRDAATEIGRRLEPPAPTVAFPERAPHETADAERPSAPSRPARHREPADPDGRYRRQRHGDRAV